MSLLSRQNCLVRGCPAQMWSGHYSNEKEIAKQVTKEIAMAV